MCGKNTSSSSIGVGNIIASTDEYKIHNHYYIDSFYPILEKICNQYGSIKLFSLYKDAGLSNYSLLMKHLSLMFRYAKKEDYKNFALNFYEMKEMQQHDFIEEMLESNINIEDFIVFWKCLINTPNWKVFTLGNSLLYPYIGEQIFESESYAKDFLVTIAGRADEKQIVSHSLCHQLKTVNQLPGSIQKEIGEHFSADEILQFDLKRKSPKKDLDFHILFEDESKVYEELKSIFDIFPNCEIQSEEDYFNYVEEICDNHNTFIKAFILDNLTFPVTFETARQKLSEYLKNKAILVIGYLTGNKIKELTEEEKKEISDSVINFLINNVIPSFPSCNITYGFENCITVLFDKEFSGYFNDFIRESKIRDILFWACYFDFCYNSEVPYRLEEIIGSKKILDCILDNFSFIIKNTKSYTALTESLFNYYNNKSKFISRMNEKLASKKEEIISYIKENNGDNFSINLGLIAEKAGVAMSDIYEVICRSLKESLTSSEPKNNTVGTFYLYKIKYFKIIDNSEVLHDILKSFFLKESDHAIKECIAAHILLFIHSDFEVFNWLCSYLINNDECHIQRDIFDNEIKIPYTSEICCLDSIIQLARCYYPMSFYRMIKRPVIKMIEKSLNAIFESQPTVEEKMIFIKSLKESDVREITSIGRKLMTKVVNEY